MARRKSIPKVDTFKNSALANDYTFMQYYQRLLELSISMFEWQKLPPTVDSRFIELGLFERGSMLFFRDDVMEELCLPALLGGQLDVYNTPISREAYASNGYRNRLDASNSVIVWNNMLRSPSFQNIYQYSYRLYEIDRTIDVNVRAQKTPVLIQCSENERLTMQNLYMQYDGNTPVIYGDDSLNPDSLKVLKTDAPYLADKLYSLKTNIWNEALTYLGIPNVSEQKKERLISDEVQRGMGGTIASRFSRLHARQQACEDINKMFGLDVWCEFRQDIPSKEVGDILDE